MVDGINLNSNYVTVAQDQEKKLNQIIEPAWKASEKGTPPSITFGVEGDMDPSVAMALTDAEYAQVEDLVAQGVGYEEAVKHVTGKTMKDISDERYLAQRPYFADAREKLEAGDYQGAIGKINEMWEKNIGNRQT